MPNPFYIDMASGNVRCPLAEQSRNLLNSIRQTFTNSETPAMQPQNESTNVSSPLYQPETLTCHYPQTTPEIQNNNFQRTLLDHTSTQTPQSLNENISTKTWSERTQNIDYQQRLMQISIQEEPLTIQVTSDEDNDSHSWRPHLSNSDILAQPLFQSNSELSIMIPIDCHSNPSEEVVPDLIQFSQGSSSGRPETISRSPRQLSEPLVNIQSYLHSQKSQLNILKYEVLNAERNVCTARYETDLLTSQINDHLVLKNSQDIEKLTQENTALRLECQCLCLEVDHYLKGEAPLGEVNEEFYHDNLVNPDKADTLNATQSDDTAEDDDTNWECTTCTFDNHPAISACEMCHMPRSHQKPSPFLSIAPGSCLCHPEVDLDSS